MSHLNNVRVGVINFISRTLSKKWWVAGNLLLTIKKGLYDIRDIPLGVNPQAQKIKKKIIHRTLLVLITQ
jgi:hypothetical protein